MTRPQLTKAAIGGCAGLLFVIATWAGRPITLSGLGSILLLTLPLAGIYSLAATGLVVVYSTTGVFNFAQGALGTVTTFCYWQVTVEWGWPSWIAGFVVIAVVAPLLGVLGERLLLRHLPGKALVVQLMVTVGLLFGALGLVNTIWDPNVGRSLPFVFGGTGFAVGSITVTWHRFITVVVSLALVVGLQLFLRRARLGIAMRAVVDDGRLAELEGIRPAAMSMLAWGLGSALAAVAGLLLAPETDMSPGGTLTMLVVAAFAAAALGQMRNLRLTYVGALLLAGFTVFSQSYLELGGRWRDVPAAYPALMLLGVLLLLPESQLTSAGTASPSTPLRVASAPRTAIGMVAAAGFIAVVGSMVGAANLNRLGLAMCTALVMISLVPLTGWAGQVSLAPMAFASIGAIAYAHLTTGGPHLWAIPLAALVAVPVGAALAFPALRLQGLYLALATFAFATICASLLFAQPFAFAGQSLVTPRLEVFGLDTTSRWGFLVFVSVVFASVAVLLAAMFHGRWGRRFVALRDSEVAASTVGVNVATTKLIAFMLSAFLAGLGGVFLGMYYERTDASAFQPLLGLSVVLLLVIGGVSQTSGALVGALFLVGLSMAQESFGLPALRSVEYLLPGLLAIGIVWNPGGVVPRIGAVLSRATPRPVEVDLREKGLSEPFTSEDLIEVDRVLGLSGALPGGTTGG